nr:alpha/beta hydrolase [Gordonia crocea]
MTRGSLELAVRTSGPPTAVPVLLVHGMGGDHTTWRAVARALRTAGRRVAAVDLRGHGRSGRAASYRLDDFRDDLRFVVDDLGSGRVDVIAHSLGAQAAVRWAMAEPDRVGRMVLEELPPMPRDDADLAEDIEPTASAVDRVRGLLALAADPRPFLRFDRRIPAEVGAEFKQAEPSWWDGLAGLAAPTLVISGGDRSFLPPHHLQTVAETLPDGGFTTISAGHSVHRDRPREFLDAVLAHLDVDLPG